jgi:iron complex outermembrane receptor protein
MNGRLRFQAVGIAFVVVFCTPLAAQTAVQGSEPTPTAPAVSPAADDELAEVLVTAQRRTESAQKVPITINAFDADTLTQGHVTGVNDLVQLVPGFRGSGDNGASSPHIRGVGSVAASGGNDSAVSYYVDGVYIPTTIQVPTSIFAVDRVEVLKGPQGTLFGRNATAGVVQIVTRSPTDQTEAEVQAGYANYNTKSAYAYLSGPIASSLFANIAFNGTWQGEGWGRNLATGEDVRKVDGNIGFRAKIVFAPSDATRFTLSSDYAAVDGTGIWSFSPDSLISKTPFGTFSLGNNPWNINSDSTARSRTTAAGVSGTLVQDLPFATLTNITAYRNDTLSAPGIDFDTTPVYAIGFSAPANEHEFSEEFQLSSRDSGPLRWTAGAYYFHEINTSDANQTIGPVLQAAEGGVQLLNNSGRQIGQSIAGYMQADYRFVPGWTLTAGGRYTDETRDFIGNRSLYFVDGTAVHGAVVTPSVESRIPTWRFALNHEFNDEILAYVSDSKGFRSGGFNVSDSTNPAFRPEYLNSYEAGLKSTLLERRLRLNASAFYYDYRGIQLSAFNPQGGVSLQQVYNAAAAQLYGLDFDFEARISGGLRLTGGFELMHGKYTDFPDAILSTPGPGGVGYVISQGSATGNTTAQTPTFSGSLGASYDVRTRFGLFTGSADLNYNSGYFFEADNRGRQPAYTLVGGSLRYTLPNAHTYVEFWGKNLANEMVRGFYITTPFSSASQVDPPRTYGVSAGYKF